MMLPKEAFELPLEKQLRFQVIKKEIEECDNKQALRENLIACSESLLKYQHLAAKLAELHMSNVMTDFFSTMGIEVQIQEDGS